MASRPQSVLVARVADRSEPRYPAVTAGRSRPDVGLVTADSELAARFGAAMPSSCGVRCFTTATLADGLMDGTCSALVLDSAALGPDVASVTVRLAEQFPDIALVVVGTEGDEHALAPLIRTGQVCVFLRRPASIEHLCAIADAAGRHAANRPAGAVPPVTALPPALGPLRSA